MRDPYEGLTTEGIIKTGVRRDRIPLIFESVIENAIQAIKDVQRQIDAPCSLYLYGSVAVGTAISPLSDVDLLLIGAPEDLAKKMATNLSAQFRSTCRGIEIAPASYADLQGASDSAYGFRVFLRHYCLHLHGRDVVDLEQSFRGDIKAARGFNGDIKSHYHQWCLDKLQCDPEELARLIARKTLLAVAGIVSVHDHIWTTDRISSAERWADLNPQWRTSLEKLILWSEDSKTASLSEVDETLSNNGIINFIVEEFQKKIGLWS